MEKRIKHILAFIAEDAEKEKAVNEEDHSINFVISSDKIDRDNEIVEVAAVAAAIREFAKNPVALTGHQHRLADGQPPVIGNWDTETFKVFKHHCEMRLRFAVGYELAQNYWYLYSNKFMRAVSLGFFVIEGHRDVVKGRNIFIITEIELFEISPVPVGANRQALAKKLKDFFGYSEVPDDKAPLPAVEELEERIAKAVNSRLDSIETSLDEIKSLITPDPDDLAGSLLGAQPEPAAPGGKNITAEQIINALTKYVNEH